MIGYDGRGNGVDAASGNSEFFAQGRVLSRALQRHQRVLPPAEDAGLEEAIELAGEVASLGVLIHLKVLGGAPNGHDVEGAESDGDAVAELGAGLEGLSATGKVRKLDDRVLGCIFKLRAVPLQAQAFRQERKLHPQATKPDD